MERGGKVVEVKGSNRSKCRLLALLFGGGGSVLLTAIAITAGVASSTSSSEIILNTTSEVTTGSTLAIEADSTPSTKASTAAIATTMTTTYITDMVVALSTGSSIDDDSSSTAADLKQSTEALTTRFEAITTLSESVENDSITDCGDADVIDNADISYGTDASQQPIVTYECHPGYELEGEHTRTCGQNSVWLGLVPFCSAVNCGYPGNIENGEVFTPNGTEFKANITYVCHSGYELEGGNETRECLENVHWSGNTPMCTIVHCDNLTHVDNSEVYLPNGTGHGSIAMYYCDTGYYLLGNDTRECGLDKQWSIDTPTCQMIDCGPPEDIYNGLPLYNSTVYGAQALYVCHEGYEEQTHMNVYCGNNRLWISTNETLIGRRPICEVIDCGPPNHIGNGNPVYNSTTLGSEVIYRCYEGYVLDRNETKHCGADGEWQGIQAYCRGIDCGEPAEVDNGNVNLMNGSRYNSLATYECNEGFVLLGNSTRVCRLDSEWSDSEPECGNLVPFVCDLSSYSLCNMEENSDIGTEGYRQVFWTWKYGINGYSRSSIVNNNEQAVINSPALYNYDGDVCLSIDFYLVGGDIYLYSYTDSMPVAQPKTKLLQTCSNFADRRSFSLTLDMLSGNKVYVFASKITASDSNSVDIAATFSLSKVTILPGMCQGDETEPSSGELTSPRYPANYKPNLNKIDYLEVAYGKRIKITFPFFATQSLFKNIDCYRYDYLKLTDMDTNTSLGLFCGYFGSNKIDPIYSNSNKVQVKFVSDASGSKRGWELKWEEVDCGNCDCASTTTGK